MKYKKLIERINTDPKFRTLVAETVKKTGITSISKATLAEKKLFFNTIKEATDAPSKNLAKASETYKAILLKQQELQKKFKATTDLKQKDSMRQQLLAMHKQVTNAKAAFDREFGDVDDEEFDLNDL